MIIHSAYHGSMNDVQKFLTLFEQQALLSLSILDSVPPLLWTALPADSDTNYLGTRINKITVDALVRHMCLTETGWIEQLPLLAPGAAMPPPIGSPRLGGIAPGPELVAAYRRCLAHNLQAVAALGESDLAKELTFVGRRYTVQGFLWAIYGHHCYHFGQADLLLRQQGFLPGEFLEYARTEQVII